MTMPGFAAEASLYPANSHYRVVHVSAAEWVGSAVAQSLFCSRAGQACGGIDLVCCPGLRCTAGLGGRGICVPNFFNCSPCIGGRQFCCPPPGFGVRCFIRSCITPL
jgi:hypothetical protein